MRAAVYYGNHQLKIEDVPEPTAGAGQVKVRVSRNGRAGYLQVKLLALVMLPWPL